MAIRTLPAKPGNPVIDSGDLLTFLKGRGIVVDGDSVTANTDGTVNVETRATTTLTDAWDAYVPPAPKPPPPTVREELRAKLAGLTTLDELKAFVAGDLIPATVRDEPGRRQSAGERAT